MTEDQPRRSRLHLAMRPLTSGQQRPAGRDPVATIAWVIVGICLTLIVLAVGSLVLYVLVTGGPGP